MKLITILAAGMFLLGAFNYARADELNCEYGSHDKFVSVAAEQGIAHKELSPADVARIIEKKGPPPNGDKEKPFTAEIVETEDQAKLFFFQDGCLVNTIGPLPKYFILRLFDDGQVESDTMLFRVSAHG